MVLRVHNGRALAGKREALEAIINEARTELPKQCPNLVLREIALQTEEDDARLAWAVKVGDQWRVDLIQPRPPLNGRAPSAGQSAAAQDASSGKGSAGAVTAAPPAQSPAPPPAVQGARPGQALTKAPGTMIASLPRIAVTDIREAPTKPVIVTGVVSAVTRDEKGFPQYSVLHFAGIAQGGITCGLIDSDKAYYNRMRAMIGKEVEVTVGAWYKLQSGLRCHLAMNSDAIKVVTPVMTQSTAGRTGNTSTAGTQGTLRLSAAKRLNALRPIAGFWKYESFELVQVKLKGVDCPFYRDEILLLFVATQPDELARSIADPTETLDPETIEYLLGGKVDYGLSLEFASGQLARLSESARRTCVEQSALVETDEEARFEYIGIAPVGDGMTFRLSGGENYACRECQYLRNISTVEGEILLREATSVDIRIPALLKDRVVRMSVDLSSR